MHFSGFRRTILPEKYAARAAKAKADAVYDLLGEKDTAVLGADTVVLAGYMRLLSPFFVRAPFKNGDSTSFLYLFPVLCFVQFM